MSDIPIQSIPPAPRSLARRSLAGQPLARRRSGLQRDLLWLLGLKFAALGLLWLLFFSTAQQPVIDAAAASRQLAVESPGD